MTTRLFKKFAGGFFAFLIVFVLVISCRKNELHLFLNGYQQVNLVSDTMGFGAAIIDPNLVNAWGIAEAPSGPIWISSNGPGLSVIYNDQGMTLRMPVAIPSPDSSG